MNQAKGYVDSPFGTFEITGNENGIRSLRLLKRGELHTVGESLPVVQDCKVQMEEYFQGKRKVFDLPLDWEEAPEFHRQVWSHLLKIPYGRTSSYIDIAIALGDRNTVRAVGQANRNNRIPIIVPCHRVIAKNGDLHGYYYGLEMKRKLLQLENPIAFGEQASLF